MPDVERACESIQSLGGLFCNAPLPSAQIVMLTIHEDDAHRANATTAGASAYVTKRVMQTELVPTLAALLANNHHGEEVRNNAFLQ